MKRVLILAAALLAGTVLAAQDDPLRTARDLYASAAYEEALAELTRAASGAALTPVAARDVDVYRAFCLVALSRAAEAETIAESLVRRDPFFTLDRYRDASPRIASVFASVRARVLPEVIWEEYRTARTPAAARTPDASSRLSHVRQLLDEAQKIGAWDKTLAELQLLVDGFLELSREPEPAAPAPLEKATALDEPAPAEPVLPSATSSVAKAGDAGVVSPIVIFQTVPQPPPALFDLMRLLHRTGTIDVVIDERGAVEDVTVRQSVNAAYDALLVSAARTWRYQPARKDGVPVRFVKTVSINVQAP